MYAAAVNRFCCSRCLLLVENCARKWHVAIDNPVRKRDCRSKSRMRARARAKNHRRKIRLYVIFLPIICATVRVATDFRRTREFRGGECRRDSWASISRDARSCERRRERATQTVGTRLNSAVCGAGHTSYTCRRIHAAVPRAAPFRESIPSTM